MTEPLTAGADLRVGILTTDTDLVVLSWDASLERMTGIPAERAKGQRLDALVPDLKTRISADLIRQPLVTGSVQVLAPAIHRFLIPCPPVDASQEFDRMQQRVVIGALRDSDRPVGLVVTIEDVTARIEGERLLARRLRDADAAARMGAVRRLAEIEPVEGLGPLEIALTDEDWQVRRTAVRALAARPAGALVDSVIAALRDGHHNFSLLSSALELLSLTGVDVTDALISLMQRPDADLRLQAALALGTQRGPAAVDALLAALDDPDVNVRFHAIEALGRQGSPAASERLAAIAVSGEFFLAFAALEALLRIGDPLAAPGIVPLLDNPLLSGIAADALAALGDEDAIAPLVGSLASGVTPVDAAVNALAQIHQRHQAMFASAPEIEDLVVRTMPAAAVARIVAALPHATGQTLKHLVIVLGWLSDPAIPAALARLLGATDVRHEVIEALVRFGPTAVPLIIDQLSADDAATVRSAVVTLGRLGDARATPALVEVLLAEEQREVWVPVAGALARLGDRRAFEALLSKLGDTDAGVRLAAIGALNSIGHPGMDGRIVEMLEDDNPLVRESAVRIAGYFGYADCVERVFACCADASEPVRTAALEHLPYFEDPRVIARLERAIISETPRARAAAAQALGSVDGARAQQLLLGALDDAEPWVRYVAALSLGRHRAAPALSALERLARSDAAVHVGVAAIDAIAAIGSDAAVAALEPLAGAADDRAAAALRALGRIPSARAVELLREAMQGGDPARRLAAVEALGSQPGCDAVDALAWAATVDGERPIARAAMSGLRTAANRQMPDSGRAVDALLELLREPARRADALEALAQLARPAVAYLTTVLSNSDARVRREVVEALGRLSDAAASAALIEALSDADEMVRRNAVLALARVGARGVGARLAAMAQTDPSEMVRQAAGAALHRYGPDALPRNG